MTVVTIGVFDGVHLGHRATLASARAIATRRGLGEPLTVLTFDPHPAAVVRPGSEPAMLTTVPHRVRLLRAAGADAVQVLRFTESLSKETPEDFVRQVLADDLGARAVVVGANFRFGHRAVGTVETLRELGPRYGFETEVVGLVGEGPVTWSSTYIRQCVLEGDVGEAAAILARPHRVEGEVVLGDRRGRDLGYPTANLAVPQHCAVPADGVYAGWLVVDPDAVDAGGVPEVLPAAVSVGSNPTFDGAARRVEAYALDRDDLDLYGRHVAVDFVDRLRDMTRFDSVDALLEQMAVDVERTRVALRPA